MLQNNIEELLVSETIETICSCSFQNVLCSRIGNNLQMLFCFKFIGTECMGGMELGYKKHSLFDYWFTKSKFLVYKINFWFAKVIADGKGQIFLIFIPVFALRIAKSSLCQIAVVWRKTNEKGATSFFRVKSAAGLALMCCFCSLFA